MPPKTLSTAAPPVPDAALPIDTSAMSEGQRQALEVAESARDEAVGRAGFAASLLLGRVDPRRIMPFPVQDEADGRVGDEFVRAVRTFLLENLDPELADETRTIPADVVAGLQRLGVFRMKVPVEYGGLGLSQVNYNRVLMAIASYCGSTAVLVSAHQSIGVPQPLKMFGTDEQKDKYLRMISEGALSAFALTEPEVGSDPARMSTTARLSADGTHYVLDGVKLWTTNGPIADLLVVMAQTAPRVIRGRSRPQITAFIVETDTPGVEVLHRCDFMGLRAIHNGVLRFTDVRVPVENVLWGEGRGLKLALRTLNTGRLTLPAACTGIAKQCLGFARRWGTEREQWGQAIGRHEAGRDKIAFIASSAYAMEAVTWLTSHWADEGRDIRIEAAMAKLFCSETAWRVLDTTLQFRGGRGYERATSLRARGEEAYPIERMMRDGRINTIIEGTTDIMRLFLAREALDPHLKLGLDLMRPGATAGERARCALRMARFYGAWYPRRIAGRFLPSRFKGAGPLGRHGRYLNRASHRLAATLFGSMARHREKLEREQLVLAHLMDIATELFAMSAVIAYARRGEVTGTARREGEALADVFCRRARGRIACHYRSLRRRRDRRAANRVAGQVLDGHLHWLEQGIIPIGADARRGHAG